MGRKKPVILLVEDDPPLIEIYSLAFRSSDFILLIEADYLKAFELARDKQPVLVLLDIILPAPHHQAPEIFEKLGFEFLKKIREDSRTRNLSVIMFTNLDSFEDREIANNLGAVDYLIKSDHTPRQVLDKIHSYLKRR